MSGRVLLAGSGEFTPAMRGVDYALLGKIGPHLARVAIVPTAAGREETPPWWAERGISHFRSIGASPFAIMVLTREDAHDPRHVEAVRSADWVYFSGGDPGHVVDVLQDSPFWRAVRERHREGAIIAGSSAGAMMLGEQTFVPIDRDPDTGLPRDVVMRGALGVLPGIFVFPHFDAIPDAVFERWSALWPKELRLLAIDEDTAIISGEDGWAVHGVGRAQVLREPGDRHVFVEGMTIAENVLPL